MKFRYVLAIETSCDDSSAAVVAANGEVVACLSADQNQAHEAFGGIVPEIASRNHTYHLLPLVDSVLKKSNISIAEIDGIAVTARPGLVGSLLVGMVTAKSLALAWKKPFIGINHLEGHLLAPFLRDAEYQPPSDFVYPYIALAISGGHTSLYVVKAMGEYEILGHTIDDAAGEAFDKFAKMLGLGFPGGVRVDHYSKHGDRNRFQFPRPMMNDDSYLFSFSGLKAAAARLLAALSPELKAQLAAEAEVAERSGFEATSGLMADLCASYQEAICDILLNRLQRATRHTQIRRVVLTGGVSANSRLRDVVQTWCLSKKIRLVVPPLRYCTDNAAMIGYAGILRLNLGQVSDMSLAPHPRAPLSEESNFL
jgi:N6-L-threonylcarbamoyladenine synthase